MARDGTAQDLTARHPRTGELLSTVKFMAQTLAAAGELQRDLQRELTCDGPRAAEAKGSKGGRRPARGRREDGSRANRVPGSSGLRPRRQRRHPHGRRRPLPDHTATEENTIAPEPPVTFDQG
ncbi:hypothetical protein [Streptomyces massasporeus]|uniref:hypothetical protein n=1 Tax=Streptomyces massasporeus TaxID=67324 RepID=UPI0033CA9770